MTSTPRIVLLALAAAVAVTIGWTSARAAEKGTKATVAPVRILAEVVSVDAAKKLVVVRESTKDSGTKEVTVYWTDQTNLSRAGAAASGNDIATGDTLKMTYRTGSDGRNVASDISIIKATEKNRS